MCKWTDKHFSTQEKKKCNNYAQNIRHCHTKFSPLGNQVYVYHIIFKTHNSVVAYEPHSLYSSTGTCIWTDKHFSKQGKKKCNNYAQNIRHSHTKFSQLGNQVPWICAPPSAILELSSDVIKTHFKILFKKTALIIRLNMPVQIPTFSIVTTANDKWGFMIFQTEHV